MKRCLLCVLPPPPWIRSSRCFKTLSPSPHARETPARPIGPAKPPHVPRSTSHDLPARSDSIAPGSTSASLTPNATSLRAPSLPRSPACPSAAGARTTGERTRTSGVGAARGPSGGQFAGRAAAWHDVTAAQKVPIFTSLWHASTGSRLRNPAIPWVSRNNRRIGGWIIRTAATARMVVSAPWVIRLAFWNRTRDIADVAPTT